ncbi:MAG: FAD:protein FMN transferase [Candidatus Cloacimonetes bacterium]|nr:FAD:protein FMN transferase [Candidatus Cloacimonadota bacterium]
MKKRIVQISFIIILLVVIYVRINHERSKPIKETRFALGTFVTLDIQDKNPHNKEIIDSVFALIKTLEEQFSSTYESSETSSLNACRDSSNISESMAKLLKISEKVSTDTEGAFDVTVGILLPYYDFIEELMPSKTMIDSLKSLVDFNKIYVNDSIFFKNDPRIRIDFGGIAKGFIVDKAVQYLKDQGIKYAVINAGGDLYVMENPQTDVWKIGIQHPRNEELLGSLEVKNMAVVTSGDYEQFFIKERVRIHHILDPQTGYPADKSVSITVIAPDATYADAMCTALFVMGPDKGIQFINKKDSIDALIVFEKNGYLYYDVSENFDKYNFTLLDSTVYLIKENK